MSETTSLGEGLARLAMSNEMKKVADIGHKIFDDMSKEKKIVIDLMFGSWGCSQCANEAYDSCSRPDLTDSQKVFIVGNWADMSLAALKNVMILLNKTLPETLVIMDSTSEWLTKQGWHGLPSPRDENGTCCFKTANGMFNDMVRFSQTRIDYTKSLAAQREAEGESSSRRR